MSERFREWMDDLNEKVIQEEFGYEEGEFDAFPELWEPLYLEGLSPREAWMRALDSFAASRE